MIVKQKGLSVSGVLVCVPSFFIYFILFYFFVVIFIYIFIMNRLSMSKATSLSSSSPEFKGIAGLNIIYEAGK